jgi:hypothetical protein
MRFMDRNAANDTWLNITFEGLCLFEMDKKSATVHFIDGERAGIVEHVVVLEALKEQVVSSTLERAPDHIIHVAAGTQAWRADPQFEITGPFNNGTDSLEFAPPIVPDSSGQIPAPYSPGDPAWESLDWVANLDTLCGAKGIKNTAHFLGKMKLNRGRLQGRPPTGSAGAYEWKFSDPKTKSTLQQQVLTNTGLCSCPISGATATIKLGTHELVLRRVDSVGPAISLFVRSLSATPQPLGAALTILPNIHEFPAYFTVVNNSFIPHIKRERLPHRMASAIGRQGGDVEPMLCMMARATHLGNP